MGTAARLSLLGIASLSIVAIGLLAACGTSDSSDGAGAGDGGDEGSTDDGGSTASPDASTGDGALADGAGDAKADASPDAATSHAATWSKMFGDGSMIDATGVAVDAQGNVVIVGSFRGTVDFGGGPLTAPDNSDDIFVAKLDPNGKHLWSKRFGESGSHLPFGVAVDSKGAVVVVGDFIDSLAIGAFTLTGAGAEDVFVAKLDASGTPVWAHAFGDAASQAGFGVAVDRATDDIAITGYFAGSMNVGGVALTSAGGEDVFVAKLDTGGKTRWARALGDAAGQTGTAIAFDATGGVAVTGGFQGSIALAAGRAPSPAPTPDAGAPDAAADASSEAGAGDAGASDAGPPAATITSAGMYDLFVVRLDAGGAPLWARSVGDADQQIGYAVAIDAAGAVFVTGSVDGVVDFGDGKHVASGNGARVLAKLDASGKAAWSKMFGEGAAFDRTSLTLDGSGDVIVTGDFIGQIDFGTGAVLSHGSADLYLAKYSGSGALAWSTTAGDPFAQIGRGVAVDASGNIFWCGAFDGTIDLGDGPLTSPGSSAYLAKLSP